MIIYSYYYLLVYVKKSSFFIQTKVDMIKNRVFLSYHKNYIKYTLKGTLFIEKINLHLKGYKLKIYYYFYTRKGVYYGIK
jgi:hypothetical protein